jgi:hypothetical protein
MPGHGVRLKKKKEKKKQFSTATAASEAAAAAAASGREHVRFCLVGSGGTDSRRRRFTAKRTTRSIRLAWLGRRI